MITETRSGGYLFDRQSSARWVLFSLSKTVYSVIKKRLGLIWWDVMDEQDIGKPLAGTLGAWLVTAGTVVGFGGAPAGQAIGIIGMVLIIVGSILM